MELDLGFKTTSGNANLTSCNDDVIRMAAPADNLAHTLFKQIKSVDMYHLKACLQTLLNYDRDDGETILQHTGWRNEINSPVTYTANTVKTDEADFAALIDNQQSSIEAQKVDVRDFYSGGKKRTLRMSPFVDAFHQGKWIVPRTLLELEFYLNGAALIFNEANPATEQVRINTDDIKLTLYLCLVKLNPSVYMELSKQI